MLTTTTNTRFSYLRRVMLLPLLLLSVSIFSVRIHAKEKIESKINAFSESIFQKKIDTSKPPPQPPGINELIKVTKKLVLVNGKEANKADLAKSLKPNEVADIKFLTSVEATKKYGDKGKFGAIEIINGKADTKNKESAKGKDVNLERVFSVTQEPASFVGGPTEWQKYLDHNINRDKPVLKGAPPGHYRVNLSFIVDQEGDIKDVVAENNPGYFTKDEAIRVMLSSPKWIPAKQNGQTVVSLNKKSITFVVSEE